MVEDKGKTGDNDKGGEGDENFLGSWVTKEDATEGLKNLQTKLSDQGNEAGTLRKQIEDGQSQLGALQSRLNASERAGQEDASAKEADLLSAEQAKISKQISDLDPVDEGYTTQLTKLIGKSNELAAQSQHEKTLDAATEAFTQRLDERDVSAAHQSFIGANPDFGTPEMQSRIKDVIAADTTGMTDPLVAFREIQRDDSKAQNKELADQNEELMKRLNLKKGADETGKVILKGQGGQEPTTPTKTTGADRNAGMQAALDKMAAG